MPRKTNITISQAWDELFERHAILEHIGRNGLFRISSAQINQLKEARLMAKFDQSAQLPEVFRKNSLSILPVTRGEYVLGPFSAHVKVQYGDIRPTRLSPPALETIDYTKLGSEAAALSCAFNSGMLGDILGSSRVAFTVSGRMASGVFSFQIGNLAGGEPFQIGVENAQIEIDGGYETPELFCLCEAKNVAAEELLIRQLYYPWRLWREKLQKPVLPLFFVYSNDVFHAIAYEFPQPGRYDCPRQVYHRAYTFAQEGITMDDAAALWRKVRPGPEPELPFPQADTFARVVDLLFLLRERDLSPEEVTQQYGFDERQTNYYASACQYLGLLERRNGPEGERLYTLPASARALMALPYRKKYLAILEAILQRPVFHKAFGAALEAGEVPDKNTICRIMAGCGLAMAPSTLERRASTVRGWLDWMLRRCGVEQQKLGGV